MSDESEDFSINIIVPDVDNIGQNLQKTCVNLLSRNEFVDCTLSCSDGHLQAHKIVLSSVSQYLHNLFSVTPWPTPCSHPVILLRNSNVSDVQSILEFIYTGKLTTSKNKIPSLMTVIRELGVVSLEKAVNSAIQTCGIEMFRRLSNTNTNNNNNNNKTKENTTTNSSATSSSLSSKVDYRNSKQNLIKASEDNLVECETSNNNIVIIKSEPQDSTSFEFNNNYDNDHFNNNEDNSDNINQASSSSSKKIATTLNVENSSSSSTGNVGQLTKFHLPQLSTSGNRSNHDNNFENNSKFNWIREGNVTHFKTSNNNNNRSSDIHLQLDKGESFVYTNEDLGMISLDNMDEEDPLLQDHDLEDDCSADEEMNQQSIMNTKTAPKMEQNETEVVSTELVVRGDISANCCPWCMQVFTSVTLLQRHIKNHLGGQKNFACHYCNSTFARSAHLKRHLRVHTGEKPYSCSVCSRAFARQDKLKIHLERHLTNSTTKPPNNSMTITSYPPQNQNNTGQVPIKILIPTGGGFLQQHQHQSQTRIGNNNTGPATITPSSVMNPNSFQKKLLEKSGNCLSIS